MLAEITGLPDKVFGVRATGQVDSEDIKNVLLPGVARIADKFGKIRYLLVLDTDVKNFTTGAWIQDAKAGLQNFTKWEKIAVVTTEKSVEWFTDIFTIATPGTSKGFKPEAFEDAIKWLINEK